MTVRAIVEQEPPFDRIAIHIGDVHPDGSAVVLRFGEAILERLEPGLADDDTQPLRLREEHARALYEALARHFGGAPDMATVRADLKHERDRVDRLIGFLEPQFLGQIRGAT